MMKLRVSQAALTSYLPAGNCLSGSLRGRQPRLGTIDRQANAKSCSLAHLALKGQVSLVTLHYRARNCQSLTRSSPHFLGGEERIEDPVANVLGNPCAGIAD